MIYENTPQLETERLILRKLTDTPDDMNVSAQPAPWGGRIERRFFRRGNVQKMNAVGRR